MMMIDENIRETFDHANDAYQPMARSLSKKRLYLNRCPVKVKDKKMNGYEGLKVDLNPEKNLFMADP